MTTRGPSVPACCWGFLPCTGTCGAILLEESPTAGDGGLDVNQSQTYKGEAGASLCACWGVEVRLKNITTGAGGGRFSWLVGLPVWLVSGGWCMGYCWRLSSSLPVGTKGQCHFHFFNNTLQCLLLFVGVRAKASIFQPIVCVLHDCQNARLYHVVQRTIPSKQTTRQESRRRKQSIYS